jgi:hypothetical protein
MPANPIGVALRGRRAGHHTLAWARPDLQAPENFTLTSPAFDHGAPIPDKHRGRLFGANISPALSWTQPPPGTAELVLIVQDPDVPFGKPATHAHNYQRFPLVVVGVRVARTVHTLVCDTITCMAQVDRFSVTMPPELGASVRQAAARQGTSVSTWLTEAAADKLRNELLGAALDQWEEEDGPFTQAELDEAVSRLGLAPRSDVA